MKYYLCLAPLFYINRSPHIGHIYNYCLNLMTSRIFVINGIHSNVVTGTDEHGIKVYKSFQDFKLKNDSNSSFGYEDYVRKMRDVFKKDIFENNNYIEKSKSEVPAIYHTHSQFHASFVNHVIDLLFEKDLIYSGTYSGYYCTKDERYLDEKEYNALDNEYKSQFVIQKNEDGYYFKLTDDVKNKIIDNLSKIMVDASMIKNATNIVKNANDVFMSRSGGTEHSLKLMRNESYSIYVWFEALIYYLNMYNMYDYERVVPYFTLGKDILSFHVSILLHIMYHVLGVEDVKMRFHGMILEGGNKISKSYNNDQSSDKLLSKYGKLLTSYLLSCNSSNDIVLSEENIESYANYLKNNVRNLYKRFFALYKAYDSLVDPAKFLVRVRNEDSFRFVSKIIDKLKNNSLNYDGADMMDVLRECCDYSNKYITDNEFWTVEDSKSIKFFSVAMIIRIIMMIEYVLGVPGINEIIGEVGEHVYMALCIPVKILQCPKDNSIFDLKY